MKKLLLTVAAIAVMSTCSFAQLSGGLKGGINFANVGGDAEDTDMRTSFHFGGFLTFPINDNFSFQPELLYSSVGYKYSISESYSDDFLGDVTESYEETAKLNYIAIPLMFQYKIGKINIQAGPQLAFLASGKMDWEYTLKYDGGTESEDDTEDIEEIKKLDLGMNLGLGAEFGKLNASIRYSLGLANINDPEDSEDDTKITNNVIQLSIGYKLFGAE